MAKCARQSCATLQTLAEQINSWQQIFFYFLLMQREKWDFKHRLSNKNSGCLLFPCSCSPCTLCSNYRERNKAAFSLTSSCQRNCLFAERQTGFCGAQLCISCHYLAWKHFFSAWQYSLFLFQTFTFIVVLEKSAKRVLSCAAVLFTYMWDIHPGQSTCEIGKRHWCGSDGAGLFLMSQKVLCLLSWIINTLLCIS